MSKLASLCARFPGRELAIRRLHARLPEFRGACDDYNDALAAAAHWQALGPAGAARAEEYRRLAAELESELLALLGASGAGSGDPGGRGQQEDQECD